MRIIVISFILSTILCISSLLIKKQSEPNKVLRGMYFWKTYLNLDENDVRFIKNQGIEKLYVKIMDISWNTVYNAYPTTSLYIGKEIKKYDFLDIVPVIFITNETLLHTGKIELDTLSKKLILKTQKLCGQQFDSIRELQIDCDWSPKTKDTYFELLQKIKQLIPNKILSVTLRLHQLKNREQTGVPPADRVTLMLYNMGKLMDYNESNSILNLEETKKYLRSTSYHLPMDFILPLFNWGIKFTDKQFEGIVYHMSKSTLDTNKAFKKMPNGNYRMIHDYYSNNYNSYFNYGDEIRAEDISKEDLIELSHLCKDQATTKYFTVSFFELNYNIKIDSISYEQIYHTFN
jgi:hypothetical protein